MATPRKVDWPGLLICVGVFAALMWLYFFAKGQLGEVLRTLFFFALAVWTIVSGVIALVRWFLMWRKMTPEEREAFKESRHWGRKSRKQA